MVGSVGSMRDVDGSGDRIAPSGGGGRCVRLCGRVGARVRSESYEVPWYVCELNNTLNSAVVITVMGKVFVRDPAAADPPW